MCLWQRTPKEKLQHARDSDAAFARSLARGDVMARLELLSGVVQNLKIANSYEDFVFTKTDKTVAGAAAIGAAAMGSCSAQPI
jgi:hypothetical protein